MTGSWFVKTCDELIIGQEFSSQNCIENAHARIALQTKRFKIFSPEKDIGGLQERFDWKTKTQFEISLISISELKYKTLLHWSCSPDPTTNSETIYVLNVNCKFRFGVPELVVGSCGQAIQAMMSFLCISNVTNVQEMFLPPATKRLRTPNEMKDVLKFCGFQGR